MEDLNQNIGVAVQSLLVLIGALIAIFGGKK